jgi:DnaA family protein
VFHLPKQTDQELAEMLRFRAAQRGLLMSDEVVNYVMTRVERSAKSLIMLLDRIDRAALAQARPVTIPLINELRLLSRD